MVWLRDILKLEFTSSPFQNVYDFSELQSHRWPLLN
jgi:hypothetical protein